MPSPVERHPLRALEEHEVLDGRLAEGTSVRFRGRGIVACGCGQVRPGQGRRRADRGEHVLHERAVQHLLGGGAPARRSAAAPDAT